ncbi:MAG: VWA domain-containing protein [Silicimonas sp.]
MHRPGLLIVASLMAFSASAQDRPNTILVMDGSGSMWGQIDGVNKIVIAREVVAEILQDFPAGESLGLTVYGHRTQGDCSDIETVVAPAPGTAAAIVDAVNAINPRGKTPMTDAVVAAAQALGYVDAPATVILVSDGIETCNPDPCAAARALEEAGADFTAHVIGFDVNDAEAIGQLQCLADETGGVFLSASNASELSAALTQIAVAEPEPEPEPEPVLTPVTFEAVLGEDGPRITDPVFWTITPAPDGLDASVTSNPFNIEMEAGAYAVSATWSVAEQTVEANVSLLGANPRVVTVVFEKPLPTATLVAPQTAVAGSTVEVAWQGPDADNDFIAIGTPGEATYETYAFTRDGGPSRLRVPSAPGTYELRYTLGEGRVILATAALVVTPAEATLVAPDAAVAGETVEVAWEGPGYAPDYIAVAEPGADTQINYTLTREGNPIDLVMPVEPGTYELRYVMQVDRYLLATRPIEVTDVLARLVAPETAVAGSTIEVAWEGPDYQNDFLDVAEADEGQSINYVYTRNGAPGKLVMPPTPGDYVIRYIANQDRKELARIPITVTPVEARLVAAGSAAVGSDLEVSWEGPDYQNDYIAISVPGEDGYEAYTYTRAGSPLDLRLPTEPGEYELRYVMSQDRTVLATAPITLAAIGAELVAPAEATAGSDIEVSWTGPDYQNDYIAVAEPGEDGYVNYTYTRAGSPLDLTMPTEPGEYELRYHVGQDRAVLATLPIVVTDVGAALEAPESAVAGSDIEVAWTGPDYQNDYIAVAEPGEDGYVNYTYTRAGAPLDLTMPTEPGEYELRYVVNQDRKVLATRPIAVTEVAAELVAPESAAVGETVEVAWEGPDYRNDFIAVSKPGEDGYVNYTYTRVGAPLGLEMPAEPGSYEIRYVMNQDRSVIAVRPVEVRDVEVTLIAPESAVAGSTLEVAHDGPGYRNDLVTIAAAGADKYTTYAYADRSNPTEIKVPDTPGDYEIRYVMNQDRRVLTSVPLTVRAPD